jgi:catechol 2,3-dioxygenase-like lactoylglutathione lyase family enzyme
MAPPILRVTSVSIAAPDPRELAAFYSRLLSWPITSTAPPRAGFPPDDGWAQVRPPEGTTGPTLNFEYEAEYVPPVWPSVPGHQQLQEHLDIAVDDLPAAVAWARQTGATLADHQPQDHVRVMYDPIGHPFCLYLAD